MKKKLFIIDGHALCYRAYFAFIKNPLVNSSGQNTSAIFGFSRMMLTLIRDQNPDYFAVAFEGLPPNNIIKQKVYNNFNEGEYYNVEQIFEMMNKIFSDVHALGYKAFKSTKTAVTHLRLIMKLSNRVKEPLVIEGKTTYKVQGKNPFNLHVKKWKIIDMNSL